MKRNLWLAALALTTFIAACSGGKSDKDAEKAKMDEVIALHDTVMGKSDLLVKCKAALDSFSVRNKLDTAKVHVAVKLKSNLVMVDEAMETWMHQFDVEMKNKSHAEKMSYLELQKKQIHRIDSITTSVIKSTTNLLKTQ